MRDLGDGRYELSPGVTVTVDGAWRAMWDDAATEGMMPHHHRELKRVQDQAAMDWTAHEALRLEAETWLAKAAEDIAAGEDPGAALDRYNEAIDRALELRAEADED